MTTAEVARKRWSDKAAEPEEMARVRAHERERCIRIALAYGSQAYMLGDTKKFAQEIVARIRSGK